MVVSMRRVKSVLFLVSMRRVKSVLFLVDCRGGLTDLEQYRIQHLEQYHVPYTVSKRHASQMYWNHLQEQYIVVMNVCICESIAYLLWLASD